MYVPPLAGGPASRMLHPVSKQEGKGDRNGSVQLLEWYGSFRNVGFVQRTNETEKGG